MRCRSTRRHPPNPSRTSASFVSLLPEQAPSGAFLPLYGSSGYKRSVRFLKQLILQGYKTFASRTEFLFDAGVTAIVGPNGSGKSNVADALRWVLGEQSYCTLRGKRTEDMIFSGSEQRPRLGMAHVSAHARQRLRLAAHRIRRSRDRAARVPIRRKRVLPQRQPRPAARHHRIAGQLGPQRAHLYRDRPGAD